MSREGSQVSREGSVSVGERFQTEDRRLFFFTLSISILGSEDLQNLGRHWGFSTTIWPLTLRLPWCCGFPDPTAAPTDPECGSLVGFSGICLLNWPHPPACGFWDTSSLSSAPQCQGLFQALGIQQGTKLAKKKKLIWGRFPGREDSKQMNR